jgi:hypothetical protein
MGQKSSPMRDCMRLTTCQEDLMNFREEMEKIDKDRSRKKEQSGWSSKADGPEQVQP